MTTTSDLPDEILCDIFSLAIQESRNLPEIFKTGNNFQDCASLIDISRVCRRWREVALADSSLWSLIYIRLDKPTTKTLRRATYFADVCFTRSKDLPLTCAISISNLETFRLARPLIQMLISHEDRWSRIAINLTPSPQRFRPVKIAIPESKDSGARATGNQDLLLRYAGAWHLQEFHSNIASWFTYSLRSPLPVLSTLRITCLQPIGCIHTLSHWLPLAPNLQELEVTLESNRFLVDVTVQKHKVWMAAAVVQPHFVLPALRTLNVHPTLTTRFTCPALERYVTETISLHNLTQYLEFIERSGTPPSFRTIEIKKTRRSAKSHACSGLLTTNDNKSSHNITR